MCSPPSALDEAMKYHRRLAQAIQEHQPGAARLAMKEHIQSVGRGLRELETRHSVVTPDATEERKG
jgi:DNA-binding FadR family transcriptional regulator